MASSVLVTITSSVTTSQGLLVVHIWYIALYT